jgi:hypothetical protein
MKKEINPPLEIGDRVILVSMQDPYSPITVGNKGTVVGIGTDPWSKGALYYVKWDNGRTLNLIGDEDVWIKDDKSTTTESTLKNAKLYNVLDNRSSSNKTNNKFKKLQENKNEMDEIIAFYPITKSDTDKSIFNFLKALRESGIINMYQSADFTWSGEDFLKKYLKIQELQGNNYDIIKDRKKKKELLELAEKSQRNMINAAFILLEKRNEEPSIQNINKALRYLGKIAFNYYVKKF